MMRKERWKRCYDQRVNKMVEEVREETKRGMSGDLKKSRRSRDH